jgi:hypothetical protein
MAGRRPGRGSETQDVAAFRRALAGRARGSYDYFVLLGLQPENPMKLLLPRREGPGLPVVRALPAQRRPLGARPGGGVSITPRTLHRRKEKGAWRPTSPTGCCASRACSAAPLALRGRRRRGPRVAGGAPGGPGWAAADRARAHRPGRARGGGARRPPGARRPRLTAGWRLVKTRFLPAPGTARARGPWAAAGTASACRSSTCRPHCRSPSSSAGAPARGPAGRVRGGTGLVRRYARRRAAGCRPAGRLARRPSAASTQAIGDRFVADARALALRVPSVVVPSEPNYVLNPAHPAFASLSIGARSRSRSTRGS